MGGSALRKPHEHADRHGEGARAAAEGRERETPGIQQASRRNHPHGAEPVRQISRNGLGHAPDQILQSDNETERLAAH